MTAPAAVTWSGAAVAFSGEPNGVFVVLGVSGDVS